VNSDDLAYRRLRNHHLWGPPLETPEDVVHWLAAMQSQEFAFAKWSVAQRADGVSDAAMDQAFADAAILRTHVVRPTWHFVLPADIRWLLDLTAPRVHALNAYYYRKFGLDDAVFAKSNALFAKTLQGGRQLTRQELAATLHGAGIAASGLHLGYLLMRAELDAVICSGALRGKQQTYALFDERVPQAKTMHRAEALGELTKRYFTSRGPATLKDYLQWSSLTASDGKSGLDMVKSSLEHEVINGRTYWFAPSSLGLKPASPVIDLVQGYDEYVMSYGESKDVLQMPGVTRALPHGEAIFTHTILLDGHVIGHWKHRLKKNSVIIETLLNRPLADPQKQALNVAVERYGRFIGVPATLH
jgi:hypothetical protein